LPSSSSLPSRLLWHHPDNLSGNIRFSRMSAAKRGRGFIGRAILAIPIIWLKNCGQSGPMENQ
jgi:hypothetical protein